MEVQCTHNLLPRRGTPNSAGLDFYKNKDIYIKSKELKQINSGIRVKLPENHFGFLQIRSSLAMKQLITFAGIIDPDFTGEIKILLKNFGDEDIEIKRGERFCQLLVLPCWDGPIKEVSYLESSMTRGSKGFGSTGK